jgi:bacterioferritin-associated ferredoxin
LGSVADVDDSFAVASSSSSLDRARGAYARVGRRVVGRRRDARDVIARVVVVVVVDIARMVAVGAKCGRARSSDRSIDRRARARSTARGSTATDDARAVDRREDGFFDRRASTSADSTNQQARAAIDSTDLDRFASIARSPTTRRHYSTQ